MQPCLEEMGRELRRFWKSCHRSAGACSSTSICPWRSLHGSTLRTRSNSQPVSSCHFSGNLPAKFIAWLQALEQGSGTSRAKFRTLLWILILAGRAGGIASTDRMAASAAIASTVLCAAIFASRVMRRVAEWADRLWIAESLFYPRPAGCSSIARRVSRRAVWVWRPSYHSVILHWPQTREHRSTPANDSTVG